MCDNSKQLPFNDQIIGAGIAVFLTSYAIGGFKPAIIVSIVHGLTHKFMMSEEALKIYDKIVSSTKLPK